MEIEKFNTSRFRNAELISLGDDAVRICGAFDWAASTVQPLYLNVNKSTNALKDYVNRLSTVNETNEINELDQLFNNAWRAAKFQCKVYELSPDAKERNAAHILDELFNAHGRNLHLESYAVQNANARLFVRDCKNEEKIKEAIQVIQYQVHIDRIEKYIAELDAAIEARSRKSAGEFRESTAKELRTKLNNDLLALFKYLEVMSGVMANAEFTEMIKLLNNSIKKIENSIHHRNKTTKEEKAV